MWRSSPIASTLASPRRRQRVTEVTLDDTAPFRPRSVVGVRVRRTARALERFAWPACCLLMASWASPTSAGRFRPTRACCRGSAIPSPRAACPTAMRGDPQAGAVPRYAAIARCSRRAMAAPGTGRLDSRNRCGAWRRCNALVAVGGTRRGGALRALVRVGGLSGTLCRMDGTPQ